ncbi:MAG: efflux RND transporter periplasmic adaptor subunit [Microcystaceae cyanobacterium]
MTTKLKKNKKESLSPALTLPVATKKRSLSNVFAVVIGLSILGLLGWGGLTLYQRQIISPEKAAKRLKDTIAVERQDLTITVTANGTIQPELSVNVSPKNSGILRQLLVKEGDRVQKGELLAKMDDSNLQGQLLQSLGQLAQAQANLSKLKSGNRPQDISQAQAELEQAQANLSKLKSGNRPQDIAQVQAELQQAKANLNRLKSGNRPQDIAQAQARLESAISNQRQADLIFRQNRPLYDQGAIAERDWENSRTQSESAAAQVREAKQALSLQKIGSRPEEIQQAEAIVFQKQAALSLVKAGTRSEEIEQAQGIVSQKQAALSLVKAGFRPEEIAEAQAQILIAEGSLKTIKTQIEDTEIRAPFTGIVSRKYADPGAFVTPTTAGSAVSSATSSSILALTSRNQVVTNVSENNIAQMRLGQRATIKADAYIDKVFTGKVTAISPQSIVQQNVTSFEVKVAILDDSKNLLRSGMNVRVEFAAGKIKDVLVIPTIAIVRQEEGTGVYVLRDQQPEFVPIQTGLTVENKTEVRSGLKLGDRVLITFPDGKRPKSRVPGAPGLPGVGRSR